MCLRFVSAFSTTGGILAMSRHRAWKAVMPPSERSICVNRRFTLSGFYCPSCLQRPTCSSCAAKCKPAYHHRFVGAECQDQRKRLLLENNVAVPGTELRDFVHAQTRGRPTGSTRNLPLDLSMSTVPYNKSPPLEQPPRKLPLPKWLGRCFDSGFENLNKQ